MSSLGTTFLDIQNRSAAEDVIQLNKKALEYSQLHLIRHHQNSDFCMN